MGEGAFELSGDRLRAIAARAPAADGLVAVSSRSHPDAKTDALLKSLQIKGNTNAGSSLKFCLVAAGEADIYPRAGHDHGMGHGGGPCGAGGGRRRMSRTGTARRSSMASRVFATIAGAFHREGR